VRSLRRFLSGAGQVVETLCMENLLAATGRSSGFNDANSLQFSQRHTTLTLPAALGPRTPVDLAFDAGGGSLLAAFGKPLGPMPHEIDAEASGLRKRDVAALKRVGMGGVLATWRLYRPDDPWAVMRCVGVPACCMLPAAKPHLAFAGTEEGSVQLWNLREPGSSHPSVDLAGSGDRLALRSPTYASDCLANANAHTSPIAQLCALPVASEEGELTIASLDVEGMLVLWVVLEAVDVDASDLGQAFGSKERLLRTATLSLTADAHAAGLGGGGGNGFGGSSVAVLPTRCASISFLPTDASRLILATDLPQLLHKSRYAAAPHARTAAPLTPEAFLPDGVVATSGGCCGVAFCPDSPSHFVAGMANGSVALFHADDARPLLSWAGFTSAAITQVGAAPRTRAALPPHANCHPMRTATPCELPPHANCHAQPAALHEAARSAKRRSDPPAACCMLVMLRSRGLAHARASSGLSTPTTRCTPST
jgi:hypothetical protein